MPSSASSLTGSAQGCTPCWRSGCPLGSTWHHDSPLILWDDARSLVMEQPYVESPEQLANIDIARGASGHAEESLLKALAMGLPRVRAERIRKRIQEVQ